MISVKTFYQKTWICKTKDTIIKLKEPISAGHDFGMIYQKTITFPEWDTMKDYPKEALEYFLKNIIKIVIEETEYNYIPEWKNSFIQSANTLLNEWLKEVKLTRDDLISLTFTPSTELEREIFTVVYEVSD